MAEAGVAKPEIQHGNLQTKRDMSDVRDTAPVTVAVAERGVPGEAYNIASGKQLSIQSLLDTALSYARVPVQAKVDPSRFRVYDEKTLLADISKVRTLTGWNPNTDMSETVREILDYWRRRVAVLYPASIPSSMETTAAQSNLVPAPLHTQPVQAQACPLGNIDLFIVASKRDFPMLSMLLNSIHMFMPCRGHTHLILDKADMYTGKCTCSCTDQFWGTACLSMHA